MEKDKFLLLIGKEEQLRDIQDILFRELGDTSLKALYSDSFPEQKEAEPPNYISFEEFSGFLSQSYEKEEILKVWTALIRGSRKSLTVPESSPVAKANTEKSLEGLRSQGITVYEQKSPTETEYLWFTYQLSNKKALEAFWVKDPEMLFKSKKGQKHSSPSEFHKNFLVNPELIEAIVAGEIQVRNIGKKRVLLLSDFNSAYLQGLTDDYADLRGIEGYPIKE